MVDNIHKPIMVDEILSFIRNEKNLEILDCTFGGGGHSKNFLNKGHKVIGIDCDDRAIEIAKKLFKENNKFSFKKLNFKDLNKLNFNNSTLKFDFIFLDLGFSSNQLLDEKIGISFQIDSKLNMNYLNTNITAYEIINKYNTDQLSRIFLDYGEIKDSAKLADFIVKTRKNKKIETNFDLVDILRESRVNFRSKKIHFATQAFQALRIECNKELENLITFLEKVHLYLNNNGYLGIISFHSLEDRVVKNYFRDNKISKKSIFQNNKNWGYEILTKKPIIPSKIEVKNNSRSRSAKLRFGKLIN